LASTTASSKAGAGQGAYAPGPARVATEHWLRRALAARTQARDEAAVCAALDAAASAAQADADACALLGDCCSRLECFDRAWSAYDRALSLQPGRAVYWFNRAAINRILGRLDQAQADYDACLRLDPQDTQACLNRADLRVQTAQDNHIDALEALLARGGWGWQREVPLRYALAKEYEDLGDSVRAWQHLSAGASLRRRHLQYEPQVDLATVDWLQSAFAQGVPAGALAGSGHPSGEPIFLVGMPRTGSTLVDRMLDSHSAVRSAGEMLHMGNAVVDAARRLLGRAGTREQLIAASARIDFAALGSDYLARTRPATGHSPHFTDKLPLNYLYCAHIAAALPNARIVHVTRHPMATCYGVYKVLFEQGYPFSYTLAEIADYYLAYRRLMDHWQRVLPGRILTIAYEDLVDAPEAQCRGLLAGLGLPWEEACLAFERNPAPSSTASASQVRRPLYRSARDQWRAYAAQLEPLRQRLVAGGLACD